MKYSKRKLLQVSGNIKGKLVPIWIFFAGIFLYGLIANFPRTYDALKGYLSESVILFYCGSFFSGLLWIIRITLDTKIFYDGQNFIVGSTTSDKIYPSDSIRSIKETSWEQPAVHKLKMKDGTELKFIPPSWLYRVSNKNEFVNKVNARYRNKCMDDKLGAMEPN
jgi:hypothetical protein